MGMKNKAVVSVLEMIAVVIVLLVTFSILFPGFSHDNRWEEAFISLKGRDLILTLDRMGNLLYEASFSKTVLRNFLDKTVPTKITNLIQWAGTDGTIKPVVTVACDCTEAQKNALIEWIPRIRVNNRDVDFDILWPIQLSSIDSQSDVLLIWGDKDLAPFRSNLENYLKTGKGIVEITDFKTNFNADIQQDIFGIIKCSELGPSCGGGGSENSFLSPGDARNAIYPTYKYFHHIPMPGWATETAPLSLGPSLEDCKASNPDETPKVTSGIFSLRGSSMQDKYNFWICDGNSVYFDTGGSPAADTQINEGETFFIEGQKLLLSYIDANVKIGITFLVFDESYEGYKFKNFLDGGTRLYAADQEKTKILLSRGTYETTDRPIPVVIVNNVTSRVAWVADFSKNDLDNVGDDHKLLLISLLSLAADKKYVSGLENLRLGHLTSYVNVENRDMYEVYRFDLGLGFPF